MFDVRMFGGITFWINSSVECQIYRFDGEGIELDGLVGITIQYQGMDRAVCRRADWVVINSFRCWLQSNIETCTKDRQGRYSLAH